VAQVKFSIKKFLLKLYNLICKEIMYMV